MARRRPPNRVKKSQSTHRKAKYLCEPLESRTYFVVLHTGDVFEFWAQDAHYERVIITGNTGTVELIGSHIDENTGQITLNNMQGVVTSGPDAGAVNGGFPPNAQTPNGATPPPSNQNLPVFADTIFSMYVSQADTTTHIAVAAVPNLGTGARNMLPYTSSIGSLRVGLLNNGFQNPVTAPGGTGAALLGARTIQLKNQAGGGGNQQNTVDIPLLGPYPIPAGTQTLPANVATLAPGITVAAGNNLGQFMWGGTIMGSVNIHGSVDMFYAGWIITGNSDGDAVGQVSKPRNFNVDGDIHYLVTAAPIGTDGAGNGLGNPDIPNYESGFDMHVGGRLGAVQAGGDIFGNVDVVNSPTAPGLGALPFTQLANNSITNSWNTAQFGGLASTNNDTFQAAQYVGVINSQGDAVINGAIQALGTTNDHSANYYAVPLMAGQTVTVQLSQPQTSNIFGLNFGSSFTQLSVGVFDPDGRLIATDYSRVDPSQMSLKPFQFTADRPGAYRIAVGGSFFNNAFAATTGTLIGVDLYTLQISNLGNLAIGGIHSTGNICDNLNLNGFTGIFGISGTTIAGFRAENGDFGALAADLEVLGSIDDLGPGTLLAPAGGTSTFVTSGGQYTVAVDHGDLRAVTGSSIGLGVGAATTGTGSTNASGAAFGDIPSGFVPNGSIGFLQATSKANGTGNGATGILAWNDFVGVAGTALTTAQAVSVAVGGDYQYIEAGNVFYGDIVAKGNIGSIVAGDMGTTIPSYFQVNAANDPTKPATIDSIDVAGQFGLSGPGGPGITTGPGGNLRYLHVGINPFNTAGESSPGNFSGTGLVNRDLFFGSGIIEETYYQPGETAVITDDSGSLVRITPQRATDSIGVVSYPVRGSGGAAIVMIEVTNLNPLGGANPQTQALTAGGVNITSSGSSAEIGNILIDGAGISANQPANTGIGIGLTGAAGAGAPGGSPAPGANTRGKSIIPTPSLPPALATTGTPVDINISGSAKVDVYTVDSDPGQADSSLLAAGGHITSFTNTTGGELLNMHVNSVGNINTNGTVGVALQHSTPSAVLGLVKAPLQEDTGHGQVGEPWTFPFLLPTQVVRILGNVVSINASQGIGNFYAGFIGHAPGADPIQTIPAAPAAVPGAGSIIANRTAGNVGALTGPILGPVVTAGVLNTVVANGIGWNGSGAVGLAGIFSANLIGNVTINGIDRGAIISAGTAIQARPNIADVLPGIVSITVNGIIDQAVIGTYARFDYMQPRAGVTSPNGGFTFAITNPILGIGTIRVGGNGGIIGSDIESSSFGSITVADTGFGIFDSRIVLELGFGTIGGIVSGGYGIRDGFVEGGATVGSIQATGDGTSLPVSKFDAIVRQSETGTVFDPVTGLPIDFLNDISAYLGTTATVANVAGSTESGVIENLTVEGARELNLLSAWSIRGRSLGVQLGAFLEVVGVNTTLINVSNAVNQMNVAGPIDGLSLTTGRTVQYKFGADVGRMILTVAGPIGNLIFNSSLLDDSVIAAQGPNGQIKSITVHGNFNGDISSTKNIGKITIYGSMIGTIHGGTLGTLKLTGGLGSGSLLINSNVGSIETTGDLGVPGNTLTVNGNLGKLLVGGNLNTNVSVSGSIKNLFVAGSVLNATNATIANTITLLKVGQDIQAGAVISAHIIKKKLISGQLLGTITTA